MFERRKIVKPWEGRIEPFKIIGNVYFTGTFQSSSHLIDTGDGLILIDTGYSDILYLLIDSIYKLGFNPKDVKYIIKNGLDITIQAVFICVYVRIIKS